MNLSHSDSILLISVLENFINNDSLDIPISVDEKLEDNKFEKSLISKLENQETRINLDEIRVAYNSLLFFQEMILSTNQSDMQSKIYLKQAKSLIATFYPILENAFS